MKRKALVCAASRGIGWACAKELMNDYDVTICSRSLSPLDSIGEPVVPIHCDLDRPEDIKKMHQDVGDVDVLVFNTGGPPPGSVLEVNEEGWLRDHNNLFLSAVRVVSQFLPGMQKRGYGRIVAILSITAKEPARKIATSSVYRAALSSYFKLLSKEVAEQNIMVNCILPDNIWTERLQQLGSKTTPIGPAQMPDELARTVKFLCSENCRMLGNNIVFDGGSSRSL